MLGFGDSKKALLIPLVFIFLFMGIQSVSAATHNVPGDYATIQEAINASSAGDTVNITANITHNAATIVNVSGLTFEGNGYTLNVNVTANIFTMTALGNSTVFHNIKFTCPVDARAIHLGSNIFDVTIHDCSFTGEAYADAIYGATAMDTLNFHNNTFTMADNYVNVIQLGWGAGVTVSNVIIYNNTISWGTGNIGAGIDIDGTVSNITVANNTFSGVGPAVEFYHGGTLVLITGNNVTDAGEWAIGILFTEGIANTTISNNTFANPDNPDTYNRASIQIPEAATMANFSAAFNYFGDYGGYDSNGDGIGDTRYNITASGAYYDASATGKFATTYTLSVTPFTITSLYPLYGGTWDGTTLDLTFRFNSSCNVTVSTAYWSAMHIPESGLGTDGGTFTTVGGWNISGTLMQVWGWANNYTIDFDFLFDEVGGGWEVWVDTGGEIHNVTYDDQLGKVTIVGCGNMTVHATNGFPSGEFFVTVNGGIWTDWSRSGSYIYINNVPCPDSTVVIDFKMPSEDEHDPTNTGGNPATGPDSDNDGLPDSVDPYPDDPTNNAPDRDHDGIPDAVDPFPDDPNNIEPTIPEVPELPSLNPDPIVNGILWMGISLLILLVVLGVGSEIYRQKTDRWGYH